MEILLGMGVHPHLWLWLLPVCQTLAVLTLPPSVPQLNRKWHRLRGQKCCSFSRAGFPCCWQVGTGSGPPSSTVWLQSSSLWNTDELVTLHNSFSKESCVDCGGDDSHEWEVEVASHTSELGKTVCIPLGSRIGQLALATMLGFPGSAAQLGTRQVEGSPWLQHPHFWAGLFTEGRLKCLSKALKQTFNSGYSLFHFSHTSSWAEEWNSSAAS